METRHEVRRQQDHQRVRAGARIDHVAPR
jgi:hypothetical protein